MKEKIIKITKRLFFLPAVPTLIIAIPSFTFVIAVLTGRITIKVLEYAAYILSVYALVISVTGIYKIVSNIRSGAWEHDFVNKLLSMPIVDRFISDGIFRTEMALYTGFLINVLYVIFKTSMGIYYHSAWFISLGVYYLALAVMRFVLIHYMLFKK